MEGFGGQEFMEDMMPKVSYSLSYNYEPLRQWDGIILKVATLRERYPNLNIQVDGGLGPSTIQVIY